jgi:TolA-binding protein
VLLDTAMKAYNGRIGGSPDPQDPSDVSYTDEAARANDALNKFNVVANKYPNTIPGRQALYYAALCLEDLERHNQALEDLKKLASGSDKELANMAQYQIGVIYSRTGKLEEAAKIFRELADKRSVFVPRPLALLELANVLRQSNPKEAANVYQQIKKEFPDTTISEQADRGLDLLTPKS